MLAIKQTMFEEGTNSVGIAVPEKQQSSSDGGKGKVLYGGRVRKKTRTTTTTAGEKYHSRVCVT